MVDDDQVLVEKITGATSVLPVVPDDDSFLEILKTSGVQKPEDVTVMSGLKAFLASQAGLFELPKKLLNLIEKTSDSLQEPIDGAKFAELTVLVTQRNYAEILDVVNCRGAGKFINETRRRQLLERVQNVLFPALGAFHNTLLAFRDNLRASVSGDLAFSLLLGGGQMIPDELRGMAMTLPSVDPLKSAAEAVVVRVNQTFAGWGQATARVLASDALNIKKALEHPDLPKFAGFLNKEQMLIGLGINVTADDVQRERNLAQYTLAVLALNRGLDTATELRLLSALSAIDSNIGWGRV